MRRIVLLLITAVFAVTVNAAPTTRPTTAPSARILIVSIDGLRPDLMLRADTPTMHELFRNGSYSFWARTVPHTITLPAHTSMLTGVSPRKHEIEWDKDLPLTETVYPKFPTLFEVAQKAGYSTAMAVGKSKLALLAHPGVLEASFIPHVVVTDDDDVTRHAVEIMNQYKPQVMFVHLPAVDTTGHKCGWSSAEQILAIEHADDCIGRLVETLEHLHLRENTTILITSDHGGAGLTHMPDDARARHIVWILNGPGVRKGLDLTIYDKLIINTEDTFATACHILNLPLSPQVDGKPVLEAFDAPGELVHSDPNAVSQVKF